MNLVDVTFQRRHLNVHEVYLSDGLCVGKVAPHDSDQMAWMWKANTSPSLEDRATKWPTKEAATLAMIRGYTKQLDWKIEGLTKQRTICSAILDEADKL